MEHKKNEKPEKQIHTVGDVSALTGKCRRTIYRGIKAGKIRVIRLGASIGVPAAELQRILQKGF